MYETAELGRHLRDAFIAIPVSVGAQLGNPRRPGDGAAEVQGEETP
jgi:hypothetical protein